jgi:predicted flap endonuclease-1-like 5' DNA nuclease
MDSASNLLISYWPLAVLAGVLVILLLLPVRSFIRRRSAKPAEAPPPPPAPPMTAVQRLAAEIEKAAREKAGAARVPVAAVTVPPPRQSIWAARPEDVPAPPLEPALPVLPAAPLEPASEPPPLSGHLAFGRPPGLSAPRAGGRDDLKLIYGIGPRIERGLNDLGIFHFDQIAAWDRRTVVWVENQFSLRGKIARERWVEQAKALAPARSRTTVRT